MPSPPRETSLVRTCVEINQCVGYNNSSLSHFSAMTRPSWLGRAARNRHRHAIEQASRRWRGCRGEDSARTRRKILISTQVVAWPAPQHVCPRLRARAADATHRDAAPGRRHAGRARRRGRGGRRRGHEGVPRRRGAGGPGVDRDAPRAGRRGVRNPIRAADHPLLRARRRRRRDRRRGARRGAHVEYDLTVMSLCTQRFLGCL